MSYNTQDFLEDGDVFSFSLAQGAPASLLPSTPLSGAGDLIPGDDDLLLQSPYMDALARDEDEDHTSDELFALETEPQLLPSSYDMTHITAKAPVPSAFECVPAPDDEFADAAQHNYRLWLAGV
ncbi:LAQU0S09e02080g1_1 [Lachancea quebecensis]|uniref:LAQU0S09e02080g1_1 n=1 Tax=Lachancea quebecensis TaxID=1654605 RepID=A0A0P1KTW1_9SACH|nr:LAQU0S09e02080g1_1 [Lachancea quebecensis]